MEVAVASSASIDRERQALDQVAVAGLGLAQLRLGAVERLLGQLALRDLEDHAVDRLGVPSAAETVTAVSHTQRTRPAVSIRRYSPS